MIDADEVQQLVEVLAGVGGTGWIRVNCPLCEGKTGKPDKRQSLGFNTETGGINCWKCGTTGYLPEWALDEVPFVGGTGPELEPAIKPPREPPEVCDGFVPLYQEPGFSSGLLEPARLYLRGRGLKDEVVAEAGVGACVLGKNRGRVVVPIFNYLSPAGPWRGWVSRDYTAWAYKAGIGAVPQPFALERPYLYAKRMDREGLLYNEPCLWDLGGPVYVVEGTLDALALWPDAVAVLGKPIDSQIAKLIASPRPIVVCLDGDAHEEGLMLALKLRHLGQRAGNLKLPPKVDPDELPRAAIDEAAKRSLEVWGSVPVLV